MPQRRVVLVTGCSRGGIGYALCSEFAQRGCKVYATARSPERMQGLESLGCRLLRLDTTDAASIDAAVGAVVAEDPGGVDVLVNCAGIAMRGAVLDTPLDEVRRVFETNYLGAVALVGALGPAMVARRSGTIVNVGSATGFWALPFTAHYGASKAALQAFSNSLRRGFGAGLSSAPAFISLKAAQLAPWELAPFNVHVVHAAPGFVKTEIFEKGAAAGRILVDRAGPYAPAAAEIEGDVFQNPLMGGMFASELGPFARRFASAVLRRRPPALLLEGRWARSSLVAGRWLPRALVDAWSFFAFGLWRLTAWNIWAEPPAAAGQRPAGKGPPLIPAGRLSEGATGLLPASPPAGVGAAAEDLPRTCQMPAALGMGTGVRPS
ncbi:hypothetical protein Rsub_05116 [Raphidocelis subcapitata]|uniref:Ketoreductase domain-containing protein n=1 Tax=Raphidocelis subcapitata TaxID=307507 RepID=A0A2V0P6D8_9CHLO|nr:hypothetical protein Rsub_05116 [Raphidocelis subcapitata]|eukprot:GBF92747.1 hypothetical protein Rsub_05116 [Raphidocelis subcapitata]